ncbi:MAG: lipopolysaccharide biosynthesis protein [Chloroflexi bacterium]|nr:lipopolysaccharide biosynthesis protein [Ardenticatenaceae bacterium]MBL1127663.1 lipopolysaccharide biosynthesis protein [Chloroflexota bacterium]NOG33728.1 lipopolysaccharide biosynthesis protein [Chloroflexota bacterium]
MSDGNEISNHYRPKNLGQKAAEGIVWSYFSYAIILVSQTVGLVVLARLLTPEDFGVFAIAVMFVEVGRSAFGMGLGPSLVQREGNIDDFIDVAWTSNFLVSTVVTFILFICVPFVVDRFFEAPNAIWPAWVLLTVVIMDGSRNPQNLILIRTLDMRRHFWLTIPATVSRFIGSIIFALFAPSVWALVFGYWLWHFLQLIASYLIMPGRPRFVWDKRKFREMYSFGGWLQLKNVLRWLSRNLDSVIVGNVLGTTQLGFYNRAITLAKLPQQQLTSVVDLIAFPMFATIQNKRAEKIQQAVKYNFDISCLTLFPLILALLFFGNILVVLLLGETWAYMTVAFQFLFVAVSIEALTQSFFPLLRGLGFSKHEFVLHVLKLIVLLAILFPMTKRWGIEGSALSIVIASLSSMPFVLYRVKKLAQIRVADWLYTLLICSIGLALIWPIVILSRHWFVTDVIFLLIMLPASWLFYIVFLGMSHYYLNGIGPFGSLVYALNKLRPKSSSVETPSI